MNEEKFTDDNEFIELKKLLKEIPKVKAPDNFEFNLMTRIQNKNFEVKTEKKKSIFSWALTPAITFATTVLILVFVFAESEDIEENPWQTPPQLIENQISETEGILQQDEKVERDSYSSAENIANNSNTSSNSSEKLIKKQAGRRNIQFNILDSYSLDDDINAKSSQKRNFGATHLANASNNNLSSFDGFFLREVKKETPKDSLNIKKDSKTNNSKK